MKTSLAAALADCGDITAVIAGTGLAGGGQIGSAASAQKTSRQKNEGRRPAPRSF